MKPKILVQLDHRPSTRDQALAQIAQFSYQAKIISRAADVAKLQQALIAREAVGTTAFEDGFAIPHAQIEAIQEPAIVLSRFQQPIQWDSGATSKVQVAIALLVPAAQAGSVHVDILAKVATLLLDPEFRTQVKTITEAAALEAYLVTRIDSNESTSAAEATPTTAAGETINIVGVSACATGVAHTYMAKEALEQAGRSLG